MALSKDVMSQFAKAMVPKQESKEATLNATYKKIDGKEYVQLDGSDILTPVTSSVVAETDDRVKVIIKNQKIQFQPLLEWWHACHFYYQPLNKQK